MEIKLVKLITGEDIICELEMTDVQVPHNPYTLAMHPEKGLVLIRLMDQVLMEIQLVVL